MRLVIIWLMSCRVGCSLLLPRWFRLDVESGYFGIYWYCDADTTRFTLHCLLDLPCMCLSAINEPCMGCHHYGAKCTLDKTIKHEELPKAHHTWPAFQDHFSKVVSHRLGIGSIWKKNTHISVGILAHDLPAPVSVVCMYIYMY